MASGVGLAGDGPRILTRDALPSRPMERGTERPGL